MREQINSYKTVFINATKNARKLDEALSKYFGAPLCNPADNSNDGTSNPIVCSCSNPAAFFTVRKEGKNQGRKFYVCSSKTCDFFLWADAVTSNNNDDNDAPSNNFSNRNNSNSRSQPAKSNSNNSDNKCPTCGISLTL